MSFRRTELKLINCIFLHNHKIEISLPLKSLKIYFSVSVSAHRKTLPSRVVKTRTNNNNANTLFLVRFIITYKIIINMREPQK